MYISILKFSNAFSKVLQLKENFVPYVDQGVTRENQQVLQILQGGIGWEHMGAVCTGI